MEFATALRTCLTQKFFCFRGRASRAEFWWFCLFNVILNILTGLMGSIAPTLASITSAVLALWLLFPSLGVTTRRLHDRNLSGWWQALPLGMLSPAAIGAAMDAWRLVAISAAAAGLTELGLLVLFMLKGTAGSNRFGADPLMGGMSD